MIKNITEPWAINFFTSSRNEASEASASRCFAVKFCNKKLTKNTIYIYTSVFKTILKFACLINNDKY